jgi:hypothetical protein
MQTKQIEKTYLIQVCSQRLEGAKAEAAAIAAERRSEFETLLDKAYNLDRDDSYIVQLIDLAKSGAEKGNEEIDRLAKKLGMSPHVVPWLRISSDSIGAYPHHCSEEDRVAKRRISRLEAEAAAQIERSSMDTSARLMDEHLTPAEATVLVQAIPTAADLVPELKLEDLKWEPEPEAEEALVFEDDVPF